MEDGPRRPGPDEVVARAQMQQERFRRIADAAAALRVTRGSAAGEVEVTVDGQGQLVDVRFGDRFRGADPTRLAAELMRSLRRAQSALPDLVADLTSGASGTPDTVAALVDGYRRRFPPVDDEPAAPRPRPTGSTWLR